MGQHIAGPHLLAHLAQEGQHAGHRGLDRHAAGQRPGIAHRLGQRRALAVDQAAPLQEVEEALRIGRGQRMGHVGRAAQLHGHGQAGLRDREATAEMPGPFPPDLGAGLVEGVVARVLGQQRQPRAEEALQRLAVRPAGRLGVEVHHRLGIAVQVECDVGVAGQTHQRAAQRLQLRVGRRSQHGGFQRAAQHGHIGLRVGAELRLHGLGHGVDLVGVVAVEVLAGGQLEAAGMHMQQVLGQADRVGHGHQHDLAAQAAGGLQRIQLQAQVVGHQHAGQFVGMQ
mmetsp:Transcript_9628/g.22429  ORF Transcript_9628/g.22429 Transcript_9628/m.22429 type:complete len:283 (+) Transcript_9628:4067-4915(+)